MDLNQNFTVTHKARKIHSVEKRPVITPLTIDDIDAVVALSRKYFPRSMDSSIHTQKRRIATLYFKEGELLPNVSPIVSRAANGNVNGFLGVITKPFRYNNRRITIANCHHLMATEEARNQLMPMRLLQQFLAGPQDVSFSDGSSESTRQLWKRLGGESVIGESIYFKVPLRPLSFASGHLLKKNQNRIGDSIRFFASCTDSIAGRMRIPHFYKKKTDNGIIPLNTERMGILLEKMELFYPLFPQYEPSEIERLFRLLEGETRFGTLHKAAILDLNDEPIGWFIYYAQKKGSCEVIQAVSIPGKEADLFHTLAWHAYSMGGEVISGRLMPGQLRTPFTTQAIAVPARMWTLMKSNDLELRHVIQSGKAFMTRLEGDLWVL
ncbi:MAG: hypothetical protein WD529_03055 [Balneolaceae bacterium]